MSRILSNRYGDLSIYGDVDELMRAMSVLDAEHLKYDLLQDEKLRDFIFVPNYASFEVTALVNELEKTME